MAIGIIQQVFNNKGTSGTTLALTIAAPTAGNTLIVICGATTSVRTNSILGGGVTWVRGTGLLGTRSTDCWIGQNTDGSSTTVTLTLSTTGIYNAYVIEVAGLSPTDELMLAFNQQTSNSTTTSPTTGTITPTTGYDALLLALLVTATTGPTAGPTNGFTALTAGAISAKGAYQLVSTNGSYSTGWTTASETSSTMIVALGSNLTSGASAVLSNNGQLYPQKYETALQFTVPKSSGQLFPL